MNRITAVTDMGDCRREHLYINICLETLQFRFLFLTSSQR
jgi:hypothetical protein